MNWDAIGATGEIVGAFAVVVTLFYLAIQIRHAIKLAESDAFEKTTKNWAETQSQLLDPRLGNLFLRGRQNYSGLDALEKLQFEVLLSNQIFEFEIGLEKARANLIDNDFESTYNEYFIELVGDPGVKEYLAEKRRFHTKIFRDWLDRIDG